MIELPEEIVIAQQITETLGGKRIAYAVANASQHKFAWYTGDPAEYNDRQHLHLHGMPKVVRRKLKSRST